LSLRRRPSARTRRIEYPMFTGSTSPQGSRRRRRLVQVHAPGV